MLFFPIAIILMIWRFNVVRRKRLLKERDTPRKGRH